MHILHSLGMRGFSLLFFSTSTGFANQSGYNTSMMKPAASNLATSSPIIFLFSSEVRRTLFFHRSCFRIHVYVVLSQFTRHTHEVTSGPCEDAPILAEELDELEFLFGS